LAENGRLVPCDVFMVKTVAPDVDDRCKRDATVFTSWWNARNSGWVLVFWTKDWQGSWKVVSLQPIDNFVMGEAKYEFVNNTVNTYGTANELHFGVFGIVEYKMVSVECCEGGSSYSTSNLHQNTKGQKDMY
jgi:hypothetical protein